MSRLPVLIGFGLSLLLLPCVAMAAPADSVDFRLDDYRWEHRLVFVFAPTDTAGAVESQRRQFRNARDGFRDRDLLLIMLSGSRGGTLHPAPEEPGRPLTRAATQRLYDQFDVPEDAYRVVLVGKDGTEKRREAEPIPVRSLFETIDAMPMRQREMREDGEDPPG
ncbi:MAG: DUF4174 domain-containing protein [Salinivenus sp.]